MAAATLVAGLGAEALAQPPARVTAQGDRLIVRRCAQPTCDVVAELPRGQAAQVLSTANGWHRVLITLDGTRATTGWVEVKQTVPAAAPATVAGRGATPARMPVRTDAAPAAESGESDPSTCLTCVATRTPSADEWRAAMTALPPPSPAPAASEASAPPLRRDSRTPTERMRDTFAEKHGPELKALSAAAAQVDRDLQTYMGACYDKFLPIQVLPPGPTPPAGNPLPTRPRASIFELWRGKPVWAWTENWSTLASANAESVAFCQGLWKDVSGRAADVRAGLDHVEAQGRADDIYPGIVRDVFAAYGLSDGK